MTVLRCSGHVVTAIVVICSWSKWMWTWTAGHAGGRSRNRGISLQELFAPSEVYDRFIRPHKIDSMFYLRIFFGKLCARAKKKTQSLKFVFFSLIWPKLYARAEVKHRIYFMRPDSKIHNTEKSVIHFWEPLLTCMVLGQQFKVDDGTWTFEHEFLKKLLISNVYLKEMPLGKHYLWVAFSKIRAQKFRSHHLP